MKILSFSLLILVVYHPLLCSGLKCYTCDAGGDGNAICDRNVWIQGYQPAIVECPGMVCTLGQEENSYLEPTNLGCELRDNVNVNPSVKTYQGSDPICGDRVSGEFQCICQTDLCNKPSSLKCLSCASSGRVGTCNEEQVLKPPESMCKRFDDVCMHMNDRGDVKMGCAPRVELQGVYSKTIDKPTGYYIVYERNGNEVEFELYLCNSNLCNDHYRDPKPKQKNAGSSDPKILPFTLTLAVYLVSVYYS